MGLPCNHIVLIGAYELCFPVARFSVTDWAWRGLVWEEEKGGKKLTPCNMGNLGWKENVLPVSTVGQRDSTLAEGKLWWTMP